MTAVLQRALDATASFNVMRLHQQAVSSMSNDHEERVYSIRDAATISGFQLNTLRSLYGRGHFRIVGGEAKKGRGLAADMTFPDVMCIAVAKVAMDAGVPAPIAFEAGFGFAYMSAGGGGPDRETRMPSRTFLAGFTMLVCHPATGHSLVVNTHNGLSFAELFHDGSLSRPAAVIILLNDVERAVLHAVKTL